MKLLRFGFEGEVVPSEVTITQGQCIVPNSVIDAGYPGQVIKSAGGTKENGRVIIQEMKDLILLGKIIQI